MKILPRLLKLREPTPKSTPSHVMKNIGLAAFDNGDRLDSATEALILLITKRAKRKSSASYAKLACYVRKQDRRAETEGGERERG